MRPARDLFAFSILYLFLLFAVLLAEGGVAGWIGMSEIAMTEPKTASA